MWANRNSNICCLPWVDMVLFKIQTWLNMHISTIITDYVWPRKSLTLLQSMFSSTVSLAAVGLKHTWRPSLLFKGARLLRLDTNTAECVQYPTPPPVNDLPPDLPQTPEPNCHCRRDVNTNKRPAAHEGLTGSFHQLQHPPITNSPLRWTVPRIHMTCVNMCTCVLPAVYIYGAMWPRSWTFVGEAVSAAGPAACVSSFLSRRGPVGRCVGGNRGDFAFLTSLRETRHVKKKNPTTKWAISWKMDPSCSLQSPWERDIQVSLQSQKRRQVMLDPTCSTIFFYLERSKKAPSH